MVSMYEPLDQSSVGSSKGKQTFTPDSPSMVLYVADVYLNDVIGWIRKREYWKGLENKIFVSNIGTISTPPLMLALALCVMPSLAIVLLPLIGPCVIIKAAYRKLSGKGLIPRDHHQATECSYAKNWQLGADNVHISLSSSFRHIMGSLFWICFLTAAAMSPLGIVLVHWFQHVKQVLHSNSLSGFELCTPIILAVAIGYYTGMALIDIGHSKKAVVNSHALFDWQDMYKPPAFPKLGRQCGPKGPQDDYTKADKLKVILKGIRETVANSKQEHLFDEKPMLLDERFRNGTDLEEFVDETLEEYAETWALDTNSPHLQMSVFPALTRTLLISLSLSFLPAVYMAYQHPEHYLQGKCPLLERVAAALSVISWMLTLSGIQVFCHRCFIGMQRFLQEQALLLYIASPSAQRRAFHSVYQSIVDDFRVCSLIPCTFSTSFPLRIGDKEVYKNEQTGPLLPDEETACENFAAIVESLREPLLPKAILDVRLLDNPEGEPEPDIHMDKFRSLVTLNIATYDTLQTWMRCNTSITRAFLCVRIQEALLLIIFLMAIAVSTLFANRKATCGVVMSGLCLLGAGFHFNNVVQQGILYNRMTNETLPALLVGWGDSVRKTCRAFVTHVHLMQDLEPMSSTRLQLDNCIRCLIEPFEQMIKEVAAFENQVTAFGIATNVQTLTRLGLTLGTALATALFNYVRESQNVKDLMQDLDLVADKAK